MIRRRMMMLAQQAEKSGAKYPLVNGTHVFDKAILEVTNGNHVKFSLTNNIYEMYINISDITENTSSAGSINNVRNTSEKIALKRGDIVEYRLKNIIRTDGGNGLGTVNSAIYNVSGSNIGRNLCILRNEKRFYKRVISIFRRRNAINYSVCVWIHMECTDSTKNKTKK